MNYIKIRQKKIQNISLELKKKLDSAHIKRLCQIPIKISKCLLSISELLMDLKQIAYGHLPQTVI